MTSTDVRAIRPAKHLKANVRVPPSKSYTNRALIAAALAEGTSTLVNPSSSEDSTLMTNALGEFGITVRHWKNALNIEGTIGEFAAPTKPIHVGNAGTVMRFLTTFAALAKGETTITGDEQMNKRPIHDLVEALKLAGVKCVCSNGYPPVKIHGGSFVGGRINVNASVSSQFVSSLLLAAPYAKRPVTLHLIGDVRSMPYIDMTLHVMRSFGAECESLDSRTFQIGNTQKYIGLEFPIEGDASSASYFMAAAAITGGRVRVANLPAESLQGDTRFADVLGDMGCTVTKHDNSIEVYGGKLLGIDIDMNDLPDCVPTLAVAAAFAHGPTTIHNVEHLRYKETNRLQALATELPKLGVKVEQTDDGLVVHPPSKMHGGTIETYNDHRIAMSFAVAGLAVDGVQIANPSCVCKSFPNFWDEFKKLEPKD